MATERLELGSTPAPTEDDPSHYLPAEVAQRTIRGPGRPKGTSEEQSSHALAYKVKTLQRLTEEMDTVRIRSLKGEESIVTRLLQELINATADEEITPQVKQSLLKTAMDSVLRVIESHTTACSALLELETRRSENRLKRKALKAKHGPKTINTTGERVSGKDILSEVANQTRGAE